MSLYRQEPIKVGYYSVKFGGDINYNRGVRVALLGQVISQDRLIKESCDFMGWCPSR